MEPLLEAYAKDNPGFSFQDPTQAHKFIQWIMGYVDDNSINISFKDGQSPQEVLLMVQQALTSWGKTLTTDRRRLSLREMWILLYGIEKNTKGARF